MPGEEVQTSRVPVDYPRDLLGVAVRPGLSGSEEEELASYARELTLEPVDVGQPIRADNVRVFRFGPATNDDEKEDIKRRLSKHVLVRRVGPVIWIDQRSVSFLTNELVVKFKSHVTESEVNTIAQRYNLTVLRTIPYAGNAFLLRGSEAANYDLLEVAEALVQSGLVEYAEPNLVITAVDDQINPADFLYANQWHLTHINLPDAWQILRDSNPAGVVPGGPGDLTYGSEKIIIAVMDRGIPSQTTPAGTTTALAPDFMGSVTGGGGKVFRFFDFVNMVPNNDAVTINHGVRCAGVAAALADNASVVPGEKEGVVGAAPNCRVMALMRPSPGTEVEYADAYIWAAGFDSGSKTADFPPRISSGADVITNSFGLLSSEDSPISPFMRDCFDFLTTYGRQGKGVVLFFSAGNSDKDFALERPWAAYEKTLAVAASTKADKRATYSNFGAGIDICAPSSDGVGITTSDLPGQGNLAGHKNGGRDYTDGFGGTSPSTPLAAGVACLMLSLRPQLTWVEVRQILRDTAIQIDVANRHPVGQWVDRDGDGAIDHSQWYGFGRIDAQAALKTTRGYSFDRDLVVRDDLPDAGLVPFVGAFWNSPDVWVRTTDPAVEGAAARPGSYIDAGPHQSPIAGQPNWVYVRFRNIATGPSYDFYVRVYLTHFAGLEFVYPDNFMPTTRPNDSLPTPLITGTYLIGEIAHGPLAAGASDIVDVSWPAALVPPETVVEKGRVVTWHPCLLVEISPHDGPAATGTHVWDSNNLAQKNIQIDYSSDDSFATVAVVGNIAVQRRHLDLVINRGELPRQVDVYVELLDAEVWARLREWVGGLEPGQQARYNFRLGVHEKREVLWLGPSGKTRIPILSDSRPVPVVVGGVVGAETPRGSYVIEVAQEDFGERVSGAIELNWNIE